MTKKDVTKLTELSCFFPGSGHSTTETIRLVSPRFWKPGDTYEQALARQQESFDRIAAKMKQR